MQPLLVFRQLLAARRQCRHDARAHPLPLPQSLTCRATLARPPAENVENARYCRMMLDEQSAQLLAYAVSNHYWYQMFVDELPVWGEWWSSIHARSQSPLCVVVKPPVLVPAASRWCASMFARTPNCPVCWSGLVWLRLAAGMVGEIVADEDVIQELESHTERPHGIADLTYLYTHKNFTIAYNGDRIIEVSGGRRRSSPARLVVGMQNHERAAGRCAVSAAVALIVPASLWS